MHRRLLDLVNQSERVRTSPPRRAGGKWWLLLAAPLAYAACGDSDEPSDNGDGDSGRAGAAGGGRSGGGGRAGASGASPGGAGRGGGSAGRANGGSAGEGGAAGEGGVPAGGAPSAGASGSDPGSSGAFAGGAGGELAGGAGGSESGGSGGAGGDASTGFCATLEPPGADVTSRRCLDFDGTGRAADFTAEGGEWVVQQGAYVGTTDGERNACGDEGTLMWGSTLDGFSATDVRVRAKLTSIEGADKVVILRHADASNSLQLNFRANYVDNDGIAGGGDLVLQELVGCESTNVIDIGQVLLPHQATDTLDVEIELRGQTLVVRVNGTQALNRTFSGANALRTTAPGSVGFGVFALIGSVRIDDVVVDALQSP